MTSISEIEDTIIENLSLSQENKCKKFIEAGKIDSCIEIIMKLFAKKKLYPEPQFEEKNAQISMEMRKNGNRIYLTACKNDTADLLEAHEIYTSCVSYAPNQSNELALAFANRSAILFHLRKYEECITDIDRVLSMNYPENLKINLFLRRMECLALMKSPETDQAYEKCKDLLENMSLKNSERTMYEDKMEKSYKRKFEAIEKMKISEISQYELMKSVFNSDLKCDSVAIKQDEENGQHIVAVRDIQPGEIFVMHKPYVMIPKQSNIYNTCSECLEESWANISCEYCVHAMYCSEKCRSEAWNKYHDIECVIMTRIIGLSVPDTQDCHLGAIRLAIMAVREAGNFQKLRKDIEAADHSTDKNKLGFSEDGTFQLYKYTAVYAQIPHSEKLIVQFFKPLLLSHIIKAALFVYYLGNLTTFFGKKLNNNWNELAANPDVILIARLIFRHYHIIGVDVESADDYKPAIEGNIIQTFTNLINHSCIGNVQTTIVKGGLMMYALLPIKKGEQILSPYKGLTYDVVSKEERQKRLKFEHNMICNCRACKNNWPMSLTIPPVDWTKIPTNISEQLKYDLSISELEVESIGISDEVSICLKRLSNMINLFLKYTDEPNTSLRLTINVLSIFYIETAKRFTRIQ